MPPNMCTKSTAGVPFLLDFTFNLGPINFLPTGFLHPLLRSRRTGKHPVVMGPLFGAPKRTEYFVDDFANYLRKKWGKIDLITGSDEELALINPFEHHFPKGIQTVCTLHMEKNTKRHLTEWKVDTTTQNRICNRLYAKYHHQNDGVIAAKSETEFIDRVIAMNPFAGYFPEDKFQQQVDKLLERVVRPRIQDPRIPFRFNTNALESLNHVFKEVFDYHPERLPLAVDLAEKVAEKHEKLIMCAFVNQGDWEIVPEVKHKFELPLDEWTAMSDTKKQDHFTKFQKYQHKKEAPKTVTDKNNLIEVAKTAGQVKRKENQVTRPKSTKTRNTPNANRKRKAVQSLDNDFLNQLRAKIPKNSK